MSAIVVVGAQWGDEGKGKVVDLFTEHADLVVRYAGGPNAGHTLVVDGDKLVVRLIPSGILRPNATCLLGQGMVIDPTTLVAEIAELGRRGVLGDNRLRVATRAHLITSYHVLVDGLRESTRGAIGTTKRGVGPCYEDKAARRGLHIGDLARRDVLEAKIESALEAWAPIVAALGGTLPSRQEVLEPLLVAADEIVPRLVEGTKLLDDALASGKNVVLEGAQGTLLDVDHGTYPFVTSSSAIAGGACAGAGVGPTRIRRVYGLVKAYTTRVGGGPFPTELSDAVGDHLRRVGVEFGSVTGRPRRTGWLDLPALRYAARVNGLDALAVTKLDVLSGLESIRVAMEYEVDGRRTGEFPVDALDRARPIYREIEGWASALGGARSLDQLPTGARDLLDLITQETGCSLAAVGVGPGRDETIVLERPFA